MISINPNYLKLEANYLFAEIERKVADFKDSQPDARIKS